MLKDSLRSSRLPGRLVNARALRSSSGMLSLHALDASPAQSANVRLVFDPEPPSSSLLILIPRNVRIVIMETTIPKKVDH